jgi:hypothetical protein
VSKLYFWHQLTENHFYPRIQVQDRVRQSVSELNDKDQKDVDRMRLIITSHFNILERLQQRMSPADTGNDPHHHFSTSSDTGLDNWLPEEENLFDDLDYSVDPNVFASLSDESESTGTTAARNNDISLPERRRLSIPSRWVTNESSYRSVELDLRMQQAARILSGLRDLIAEKSFQFSHVIRVAPRKGVRTRARSSIEKINHRIGFQCRVYTQCRNAMVNLGAEKRILDKFRILRKDDIRSSTALLNPNEPGSTRHQLSWIWQTGRYLEAHDQDDDLHSTRLRECM